MDTPKAMAILKETAKDTKLAGSYLASKVLIRMVEQGKLPEEELQK